MPPTTYIDPRAGTGAMGTGTSFFDRNFGNTGNIAVAQNAGVQGPQGFANVYMDPNAFGNPIPTAPRTPSGGPVVQTGVGRSGEGGYATVGVGGSQSSAGGTYGAQGGVNYGNSQSTGSDAKSTAGGGAGGGLNDPQAALEALMNAYKTRTTADPFNTGSVTSDWHDILSAFPQLGQFMDTEAILREDLGAGDYIQPLMGAFSNDPFHLPGSASALNWLLNLQMANVGQQGGRANEAEGIMRSLAQNAQGSSQLQGAEMAAGNATELMSPGHLHQLEQAMRGQATEDVARSRMAGEQAMRDAGFFGQGGAGADPVSAMHRSAGDSLANLNRQITGDLEGMRRGNLQAGTDALGASTDVYRAMQDPTRALAGMLMGPKNFEEENFFDLLGQVGSLQTANQVQRDSQSGVEGFISSLLSPAVGAISGGAGNALSKALFG